MLVVLDANVWLSGLLGLQGRRSATAEIIYRWRNSEFEVGISQPLFHEVEHTLQEPFFQARVSFSDR